MLRTRIKICGIRDKKTALHAVNCGADAIGLVFIEKSPRYIDIVTAKQITKSLPPMVQAIGLFADEAPEHVRHIANQIGINTVQLHGRERIEHIEALHDLSVIKALTFHPDTLAERIKEWSATPQNLTALLWDTPPTTQNNGLLGGSGHHFDWQVFAELSNTKPFRSLPPIILAGGLTPSNVNHAISITKPFAVDVSSGVESSKGIKDLNLIKQFCQRVQQADSVIYSTS